jgi:hypothetical protein
MDGDGAFAVAQIDFQMHSTRDERWNAGAVRTITEGDDSGLCKPAQRARKAGFRSSGKRRELTHGPRLVPPDGRKDGEIAGG